MLSWHTEASPVLDLDGNVVEIVERTDAKEMEVTIGADGFSYTCSGYYDGTYRGEASKGFKIGTQL